MEDKERLEILKEILKEILEEHIIDEEIEGNPHEVLSYILENDNLLNSLKDIPTSFWKDVLKDGVYVYESYFNKNIFEHEPREEVKYSYINLEQRPKTPRIMLKKIVRPNLR